ncbi:MAG: hypothetical protein A2Z18_07770 [Armatimonadetes bacterium RBG_16_58_9]|nr:MAG: hypothetical protein A2Z18_07770 [Armatimonadetes bacterium RBG_16_58_9]
MAREVGNLRQGEAIELEIPSAPEYVAIVRQAVEGIARRMNFDATQIEELKLAVGEACTNAVKYGCKRKGDGNVVVRCVVCADGLLVVIRNPVAECESPQVPDKPDPTTEGGLGLYLIQHLVDEVNLSWESETATVTLLKRLAT